MHILKTIVLLCGLFSIVWGDVRVSTTDGRVEEGTSLTLDAETLTLTREGAEDLQIPRTALRSLRWSDPKALVGSLGTLKDWTLPEEPVPKEQLPLDKDGKIFFPGSPNLELSRSLPELPATFVVELKLEFPRKIAQYEVRLFSRKRLDTPSFSFTHFDGRFNYMESFRHNEMGQNWNRAMVAPVSKVHDLRFYVDLNEKKVTLLLNGVLEQSWPVTFLDPKSLNVAEGIQLCFSDYEPIWLSDFRVSPWNGEGPHPFAPAENDVLILQNFETLSGTLRSIQEGTATFQPLEWPEMPLPLARIRELFLVPRKPDKEAP
jgi:hypothetical protein